MVAYRLALLSAAALSAFGFDAASGAFLARYDRRLVPRADGLDNGARGAAAIQARGPPVRPNPSNISTAATPEAGETSAASFDLGAGSSALSTAIGGGGVVQLVPSSSKPPSTTTSTTDYIDPNDFGTSGTLTTQSTSVPARTSAPSRFSVGANSATAGGPPPAETTTLTTSTRTRPPHIPTLAASLTVLDDAPTSEASEAGSGTTAAVAADGTETRTTSTTRTTNPPKKTAADLGTQVSQSIDLGVPTESEPSLTTYIVPFPTTRSDGAASYTNLTATITTVSMQSVSYCQASDSEKPATTYSVVYTSTITWTKDPQDYTPPYPPMTTPSSCVDPVSPQRLTASGCGNGGDPETCSSTEVGWAPITITHAASRHGTIVMITTDKNPSVVYSSISTPDYGVTRGNAGPQDLHNSATDIDPIVTPSYTGGGPTKGAAVTAPTPPITVAIQPSGVVVNGKTYTDNPASPSQTVVVGPETLVINPSQVLGPGVSVDRPALTGGVFVPQPTRTSIGGVDVQVSSSVAVLDGTTFTLGQTPVTTTIKGQAVTLGPSGVVVGTETIPVTSAPTPSQIVIAGGELATAIGQSVFVVHGTTVTYGPTSSGVTVVGGDSITLGPMGVTMHGTTFGGPSAKSTDTEYEIVGGATITELGASLVVIDGSTYTIGPGTGTTITVIKGQTITIAPTGVSVSTVTLAYPFGPTTTITPGGTATPTTPGETGAAASPTPSKDAAMLGAATPNIWSLLCIAIGVVVLGV